MRAYTYYSDGSQTELSVINRDGVLVTERIPVKAGIELLGVKVDMNGNTATDTDNLSPREQWEALSEAERNELRLAETDEIGDPKAWHELFAKGLVDFESNDEDEDGAKIGLTPLGTSVLAAAPNAFLDDIEASIQTAVADGTVVDLTDEVFEEEAAPTSAAAYTGKLIDGDGTPRLNAERYDTPIPEVEAEMEARRKVWGQAVDSRPDTITVREYYRQNYIAKVIKKECTVSVPGFSASWIETVTDRGDLYIVEFQDHEGTYVMKFMPDEALEVRWLPETAPSPVQGGDGERYSTQEIADLADNMVMRRYIKDLQVENATLRADVQRLQGEREAAINEPTRFNIHNPAHLVANGLISAIEDYLWDNRTPIEFGAKGHKIIQSFVREYVKEVDEYAVKIDDVRRELTTVTRSRDELVNLHQSDLVRIATLATERDEAKAAWNSSESQWVHMARLLKMPYEETEPSDMVARVASILADENELAARLAAVEDGAVYTGKAVFSEIYGLSSGATRAVALFPEHLKMREGETVTVTITRKMRPAAESAEGEG